METTVERQRKYIDQAVTHLTSYIETTEADEFAKRKHHDSVASVIDYTHNRREQIPSVFDVLRIPRITENSVKIVYETPQRIVYLNFNEIIAKNNIVWIGDNRTETQVDDLVDPPLKKIHRRAQTIYPTTEPEKTVLWKYITELTLERGGVKTDATYGILGNYSGTLEIVIDETHFRAHAGATYEFDNLYTTQDGLDRARETFDIRLLSDSVL